MFLNRQLTSGMVVMMVLVMMQRSQLVGLERMTEERSGLPYHF